jgi:hypothetical protein
VIIAYANRSFAAGPKFPISLYRSANRWNVNVGQRKSDRSYISMSVSVHPARPMEFFVTHALTLDGRSRYEAAVLIARLACGVISNGLVIA